MSGSWLLPEGMDRERMLDMDRRIRPARKAAFGVLALALVASGPWVGWWTIVPLVVAAGLFRLAEARIDRSRHPEYGLFAAWCASQIIIGASVAMTGGAEEAAMSWFALPIATLGSRFSERGILAGVVMTLMVMLAVAFGVDAGAVIADPPTLIAPTALVLGTALLVSVLMRSDVDTRAAAVIDPLTGLLNRKALAARAAELAEQSRSIGQPVGVIAGDIDHFKTVNDTYGHTTGDAVLKSVAYTLRKELRAFDAVYRTGGEEFVVLVPGADAEGTVVIAERLLEALRSETSEDGVQVTMSFGVSASGDEGFDYDVQFARADAALYAAKAGGRDQVRQFTPVALVGA